MEILKENLTIRQWAEEDRPREKLQNKGRHVLSDAELIAILISSGNRDETAVELAKRILKSAENNLHVLGKLGIPELMKFRGIGEAKAISIIAALELGRRRKLEEGLSRTKITISKEAWEFMKSSLMDLPHEEFWVIMLNRSNHVLKKELVSRGGIAGTVVDARIIFKYAVENLASSIILCHNHPSGNLKPSKADINLTKKLKESGSLLEIPVIDHLIFTDSSYFSFADEGLL